MSARFMRRILVDYARSKAYQKRGGGAVKVTFDEGLPVAVEPPMDLVALDDALKVLATMDERKSRVIELRFFGGLSVEETATVLAVSPETIMRDWKLAKAWLMRELRGEDSYFFNAASQLRTTVMGGAVASSIVMFIRKRPSDATAYCALVPVPLELMFAPVASCVLKSATGVPGSSCRSAPTAIGTAIKRPSSPT